MMGSQLLQQIPTMVPTISQPQALQITPEQAAILAPLLTQLAANTNNPNNLSGGNNDVNLNDIDNEIDELLKKLDM